MNHMTITEVSSMLQISARMLRYYEKAGLITSTRKEGYAYRIYDADAVSRIQQIIILRKLQIPLKQIQCMMDGNRENALRILEARIHDMEANEISIHTVKKGLEKILKLFQENTSNKGCMDMIQENAIAEITRFLPLEKHLLNGQCTIEFEPAEGGSGGRKMSIAKEMAEKEKCIRIVLLPPCTVASYQFTGDAPEETIGEAMDSFIRSSRLYEKKPDARLFGFNNPDPKPDSGYHGYEEWLTIPDDMEVPAPFVKKYFPGGLYAAYTIDFPDFHEWNFLMEWIRNNETYQAELPDSAEKSWSWPVSTGGCMEEYLNWVYSSHAGWPENGIDGQVDLLMPVKKRL